MIKKKEGMQVREYIKKSAIVLVSALFLCGCGSRKTLPSLKEAGKMEEAQLKEELSGFNRNEINMAWGEGTDPFSGRYGEVFSLDDERILILYYEGDGQTVEDVIVRERSWDFEGTIKEIYGANAVVEVDEGFPLRSSGDLVSVTLDKDAASAQPGDRVRVTYSGAVMESYPLQLGNQENIQLLEETVDQIGDEKQIDVYMPFENSEKWVRFETKEPSVIKVYEVTDQESEFESEEPVTMVRYYEMSDGTWKTDDHTYRYRLEITGRTGAAVKDTTFVFLSNIEDISFEQAWKASGLSSNMADYFKEEDAKFVAFGNW